MRRRTILLLIVWSWALNAVAQQQLSASRQSSEYTYVYRLSPEETKRLYSSSMRRLTEQFLHTKVDSFLTDRNLPPVLKPGNYVFVKATGNRLEGELRTIDDLQIKILRNAGDLNIVLHDRSGQMITQAAVKAGSRTIHFNEGFQAFHARKAKPRLLSVNHAGTLHLTRIAKEYAGYSWRKPHVFRRLSQKTRQLFGGNRDYRNYSFYHGKTKHEQQFRGFMVFNKPIYKPGDTVRLKAWVTTTKGQPVNRPLLLRLVDRDLETDSLLTTITPYRPGGYETSFVINDSLDIDLDADYLLTLEELSSRQYDLSKYDGKLDEDEYALKRKVLVRGHFKYEDYLLGQVSFNARSDKREHTRGNPVAIFCKAVDENGLAVMDGRVEVFVISSLYSAGSFSGQHVFLPDTLWRHQQQLEAIGETKITIPDSIFPRASFNYTIQCRFLNSNNEQQTVSLGQEYKDQQRQLNFTQRRDSLLVALLQAGKSVPAAATLYALSRERDTLYGRPVQLPASIRLNPFVIEYTVVADSLMRTHTNQANAGVLQERLFRNKDSVVIEVVNPRKWPFWYTIYAGKQLVSQGHSDTLYFAERSRTAKDYTLSLQYINGNRAASEFHTLSFNPRELNIQVQQPTQVYPGQQAAVAIDVTDAQGQPVADADLTAFAFTRKFRNANLPSIPSWGLGYSGKERGKSMSLRQEQRQAGAVKLNWERWSREMQLDTIEYYKFLHPATIYTSSEPAPQGTTQIAPFVVSDGVLVPVQLLYIDEEPMFFNQAGPAQQYSFAVKPGKHALRIRIHNKLLLIDSIHAPAGMKTFFSINADADHYTIRKQKMPETLSTYERALWSRYLILVENNFGGRLATVTDGVRRIPLNFSLRPNRVQAAPFGYGIHGTDAGWQQTTIRPDYRRYMLVGPLTPSNAALQVYDRFTQPFELEGNNLYRFTKGQTRQKQLPKTKYVFPVTFNHSMPVPVFSDYVLSAKDIDSLWREYLDHRSANEALFRNESLNAGGNGQLRVALPKDRSNTPLFVKSIILFRYDDPDFARIYKGVSTDLGYVRPGQYRIVFLLKGDAYYIHDSLQVQVNGLNYYDTGKITPLPKDSTSMRIAAAINNRDQYMTEGLSEDADLIKTVFNNQYMDPALFKRTLTGYVSDKETGLPLAGVEIRIRGIGHGATTDINGNFQLRVPEGGTLLASYIGYSTVAEKFTGLDVVDIRMVASKSELSEVVVVGYGTVKKSLRNDGNYQYRTDQNLLGQVAGRAGGISIRGVNSYGNVGSPLYIVDGVPVSAFDMSDPSGIDKVEVLDPSGAIAIYGSRAANGVILISTQKRKSAVANPPEAALSAGETPAAGNQLRTNFRDYAWWQPRLRTDQQGKASFAAAFPDDITSWRTFVIAMAGNKRTGMAEGSVNSFKSLSGALAIPQFAIAGDSMQVIGKTMHYGQDSVSVKRSFSINDQLVQEGTIGVRHAHIDSFSLTVSKQDSVRFKYTIQQAGGIFDGEERSIPVFKAGVLQTQGAFAVLDQDTSFTVQADRSLGNLTIHAESAMMPVLLDEIDKLRDYEYGCNEQLASKLKALLLKKQVYTTLNKDFKEERTIRDLVSKLAQNRWQGKFWGWWRNNDPIWWVSLHVTDALLKAEAQGYRAVVEKRPMIDYLVYEFNRLSLGDRISAVQLLQRLDARVEFNRYIDSLDKYFRKASLHQQLQILTLRQQAGMSVALDTFIAKQQPTMMRNLYWGEENYRLFDNSIHNTLAMYRLLKKEGGHEALLKKIHYYFLEKRRDGKWRNTYESSLILETILPDLLGSEQATQLASLNIEGAQKTTVSTFPYTTHLQAGESVTIRKEKGLPVYFTAYQQSWNAAPEKVAGDFEVTTTFEANGQPVSSLKAGKVVELKVKVVVKADADYVMVEIPVPAGCSYASKAQSGLYSEVHREYFKHKVSLFCKQLQKGSYTFTVSLMPRYSGSYQLNPAKAEMMYFPVFFGREGMKKIPIQ